MKASCVEETPGSPCVADGQKRPNILCFVADEMRADSLHHLGNGASKTPHLDRLAEQGVSFENAYCQSPVCVPSRCSFLTGVYPHTWGHRTQANLLKADEPTILQAMKEAGYEVVWAGRNDAIPAQRSKARYCDIYYDGVHPFDTKDVSAPFSPESELVGPDDRMHDEDDTYYSFYVGKIPTDSSYRQADEGCVDAVCNYLKTYAASNRSKPFFIYCSLALPHPPYACADPWYSSIDRDALPSRRPDVATCANRASMLQAIRSKQRLDRWDEERFNELRATYLAMVSQFDSYYGRLSATLEALGLARETDVLVWSDHGDYTGDYSIVEKVQNCFEDPVCRVPLIIKPHQGVEVAPRVSSELCELTDIVPTIAELAGVHLSWDQFGVSLVPLLAREVPHRDCVICEGGRLHGEVQAMERGCTPDKRHWPRLSTQEHEGPEHTKACMIRMGNLKYTMRLYEDDELYDLAQDPLETVNLIHCEQYGEALQALRMRLLERYMETCDTVPRVEGAR